MPSKLSPELIDVRGVRRNQRFATYAAKFHGRRVFVKQALQASLIASIATEARGLANFNELQQTGLLTFTVPKLLLTGPDYVVTTWAPGKPMPFAPATNTNAMIDTLAEMYASVDRASALRTHLATSFALPNEHGANVADRLAKRLRTVKWKHLIPEAEVTKALQRLERDAANLSARLTHPDLQPTNILRTASGTTTVVDYESVSLLWPRFYDVVNYAHNLVADTLHYHQASERLLLTYFDLINEQLEGHLRAINTIATVRTLSAICEYGTPPDALHNTQGTLTNERAALLTSSLQRTRRGQLFLNV